MDYEKLKEELKQKYGKIYELVVPLEDEPTEKKAKLFLKPIDRAIYSAVSGIVSKDELKATEVLINSLYVGGDAKELVTGDFEALRSASFVCGEFLIPRKAELKKN